MKKIVLALIVLAGIAQAEVVLGADVSYSKANGDVTASYMGATAIEDYTDTMTALTVKGGYAWEQVRLLGYYSFESYKESDKSKSYGAEIDYLINGDDKTDLLLGVSLGKGELDADGLSLGFKDFGVKVGILTKIDETLGLELGVKYKFRNFDNLSINGVLVEGDEKQLGVYLGLNFSL